MFIRLIANTRVLNSIISNFFLAYRANILYTDLLTILILARIVGLISRLLTIVPKVPIYRLPLARSTTTKSSFIHGISNIKGSFKSLII